MTWNDLIAILPLATLAVWALLLLLVDLWIPPGRKGITALLAAAGLLVALGLALSFSGQSQTAFNGMVVVDGFAIFLNVLFLASGLAAILLAYDYLKRMQIERGEYYSLLLFTITGMILMTYANDLIIVFLALELLSLPLYVMTGFAHKRCYPQGAELHSANQPGTSGEVEKLPGCIPLESALKYFMLGAFATGFVLYGVALIFGVTGHTNLTQVVKAVRQAGIAQQAPFLGLSGLFLIGAALLLVGFGFKSGLVPFHMWIPDVYQGAPSPVTGFMSVGAKAAGFAALLRVFVTAFPMLSGALTPVLWVLAALTMILGNVVAIAQSNMKRMLAYASIAQSGYILMAFMPYGNGNVLKDTIASMLFYLVAYGITTFGAWSVVIVMERAEGEGLSVNDYAGLGRKSPWLAAAMTIFMLSFAGVPLTLGFWGKLYLFSTVVEGQFIGLAVVGLLTSLISVYYYLRVVVVMYMHPGDPQVHREPWINLSALAAAVIVLALSILPGPLLALASQALLLVQ